MAKRATTFSVGAYEKVLSEYELARLQNPQTEEDVELFNSLDADTQKAIIDGGYTSKGLKIQFLPTSFGGITPTEQNDIAIELEQRLETGLSEYELRVERDRNLKDKTIIGFFVYIEYFDKIVRKALSGQNPNVGNDEQ